MRSLILQAEEEVVAVFRQSRAVLVLPAVASAAAILLPVWYAVRYELLSALAFWLLLWSLVVLVWFVGRVYLWHRETYTITTRRLVKSVHEKVFQQVVSETALDRILNVSYRTTGAWSVVGKFGNVDVQVVGRLEPIVVKAVHDPAVMKEFLWRLHEQATNRGGRFEEANAEQVLPSQHYSPRRN
jgi:hypothetical protein